MGNLIDKFELQFGKSVRDITEEDLTGCISDPKYKLYFSEKNAIEFLDELIKRNSDTNFVVTLVALKYSLSLELTERAIDKLFSKYRENVIERTELEEKINEMKNKDFISLISVDLCSMIALSDIDISQDETKLEQAVADIRTEIFLKIGSDIEKTHKLRCDLLDLIYQTRENYFSKYQIDILKDNSWVDDETAKLAEFDDENQKGKAPLSTNIKPEEMGLIDITRLGKE